MRATLSRASAQASAIKVSTFFCVCEGQVHISLGQDSKPDLFPSVLSFSQRVTEQLLIIVASVHLLRTRGVGLGCILREHGIDPH